MWDVGEKRRTAVILEVTARTWDAALRVAMFQYPNPTGCSYFLVIYWSKGCLAHPPPSMHGLDPVSSPASLLTYRTTFYLQRILMVPTI